MVSRRLVLGIDAGGTHTRAVVADRLGNVVALERGAPGNPEAHGDDATFTAIGTTVLEALAQASAGVADLDHVVIAHAGGYSGIETRLRALLAEAGGLDLDFDVLAMFVSATFQPSGGAVLAGTGSVAGRFVDRKQVRNVGGSGWLVGDAGSGFAIGRGVARAVVSDLDGLGPPTQLTEMVMAHEELGPWTRDHTHAELLAIRLRHQLPVLLSRFAPLAFAAIQAAPRDAVAERIIQEARDAIAAHIDALDLDPSQPLVLGGSVLVQGLLPAGAQLTEPNDRLAARLDELEVLLTREGSLGAAVLALQAAGVDVTPEVYARVFATARPFLGSHEG